LVENTTINGNEDIGLESRFTIVDHSSICESVDDCFTTIVNASNNDHITKELIEDTAINLTEVDRLDVDVFRKKIVNLFKIRDIIKKHMTASDTHDSNAWNFVEAVMKTFTGFIFLDQMRGKPRR
jgi:Tfp pilus assembly pilus retraction ATPase PilT